MPSDNGHLVGWVPVDPSLRNHLWHLSVVNLSTSHALVLKYEKSVLTMKIYPLTDLVGCTFELVGTNVNANPYGKIMILTSPVSYTHLTLPTILRV